MLQPVDIASGQVSGVDSLGPAASSVINWEVDEAKVNRPRAALTSYSVTNMPASAVIGLEKWKRHTVAICNDRKVYGIPDVTPGIAEVGSTSTTTTQLAGNKRPTFAVGDSYVYMSGGAQILRWRPEDAAASTATNSPYCTHIATLGQRLIANDIDDPQVFKWSDIGEGAFGTWPAANSTNADARPDAIVGIYENISELFVFGDSTLQVYSIGADPTLPFDLVNTMNTGLSAPYCVVRLDEQFAFLDDKRRIVLSDGRSVTPISDAIGADIRGLTTISDAFGYREEIGQQSRLVFRFPTERRTFVYDLKAQNWIGERKYYSGSFQEDYPAGAYAYRASDNAHIVGSSLSTGGLYKLSLSTRQDLSGPMVCDRITGWHDYGSPSKKRSVRVRVVLRRGTAATGATPGALEVRIQNDDSSWGNWQQISVGQPHDYAQVKDLFLGGIFRRRRYQFRYSNTEDMSLVQAFDDVMPLDGAEGVAS